MFVQSITGLHKCLTNEIIIIMKNIGFLFLIIPALLVMSMVSGCYYDEILPDVPIDPGVDVTLSGDLVPIFDASCNTSGCHGVAQIAPDLTAANAYNALINGNYINTDTPESSELYQWVKGNRSIPMPISGTDQQIVSTVLIWIGQGAQNN